jgi:hypothetical protein
VTFNLFYNPVDNVMTRGVSLPSYNLHLEKAWILTCTVEALKSTLLALVSLVDIAEPGTHRRDHEKVANNLPQKGEAWILHIGSDRSGSDLVLWL